MRVSFVRSTQAAAMALLIALAGAFVALGVAFAPPAAAADDPGAYNPLAPARILDTKTGTGTTQTSVPANGELTLTIAGAGGVPASGAGAATLNLTVVSGNRSGYLTAYPTGESRPTVSDLTWAANSTVANGVTTALGEGGAITFYNASAAPVRLIADVSGWYAEGEPTAAGAFASLTPARILDTKTGTGTTQTSVPANGELTLTVADAGGVPADGAGAVVLNVTVVGGARNGYIGAYPTGAERPEVSNLTFTAGRTVSNGVTVQLSDDGQVTFYNGAPAPVRLIADVAGWFVEGTPEVAGAFAAQTPARILDTKTGTGTTQTSVPANGELTLQVTGAGGVPADNVAAAALNLTVVAGNRNGYVAAYPADATRPEVSTVNFTAGGTRTNNATVQVSDTGQVTFYNGSAAPVRLIADVVGSYLASSTATGPVLTDGITRVTADQDGVSSDFELFDMTPDAQFVLYGADVTAENGPRLILRNTFTETTATLPLPDGVNASDSTLDLLAASISDDGAFIALETTGNRNPATIWVLDVAAGTSQKIVANDGSAFSGAYGSQISGDGASVIFSANTGAADVRLWSRAEATSTVLLSDDTFASAAGYSISADGAKVSFAGIAADDADADEPQGEQAWVVDTASGEVTQVSEQDPSVTSAVYETRISSDGTAVAWTAENALASGGTQATTYVRKYAEGGAVIDVSTPSAPNDDYFSYITSVADGGDYVGFNLEYAVDGDTQTYDVTAVVGRSATGEVLRPSDPGLEDSTPLVSDDGRYVAFTSPTALTPDDENTDFDVYLTELTWEE